MKRFVLACSVAVAVLVACKMSIKVGDNVPLLGGTEIEIQIDPWSGATTIPPQPGLDVGDCVKVTFHGPNGENLGSTEETVGEEFEPPEGTTTGTLSPCDPPPEQPAKKERNKRRANGPVRFVAQDETKQFGYCNVPLDLTGTTHHYADFWVTAHDRAEADRIANDFVFGMLSEPPPAGVEPEGVVEVEVGSDSSVRVSMFSTDAPETLSFTWNDADLFDLSDASVMSLAGWFVTTVVVPPALVDVDPAGSSDNSLHYQLGLPGGRSVGTRVSVSVTQ